MSDNTDHRAHLRVLGRDDAYAPEEPEMPELPEVVVTAREQTTRHPFYGPAGGDAA